MIDNKIIKTRRRKRLSLMYLLHCSFFMSNRRKTSNKKCRCVIASAGLTVLLGPARRQQPAALARLPTCCSDKAPNLLPWQGSQPAALARLLTCCPGKAPNLLLWQGSKSAALARLSTCCSGKASNLLLWQGSKSAALARLPTCCPGKAPNL